MRYLIYHALVVKDPPAPGGRITVCGASHKPGAVISDSRGRLYRVGPAGNLIRTTPEARRG
jgi:predicted proteasome-type protease